MVAAPTRTTKVSAALVLGLLTLAAVSARRQCIIGVVKINRPAALGAAVSADAWLLSNVIHLASPHLPDWTIPLVRSATGGRQTKVGDHHGSEGDRTLGAVPRPGITLP